MRYLLLTLVFLSSFACKNPSPSDSPKVLSQEMGSYISHYTEQNLDIDESIMFRFAGTVITGDKIGQQADEVFSIAPRNIIDGKVSSFLIGMIPKDREITIAFLGCRQYLFYIFIG